MQVHLRPTALALLCAIVVTAGCQSYQPRPLDSGAHLREWNARSPAAAEVASLARRLREAGVETPANAPDGGGLTLADAEVVALVFNADLRIARLRAGVSGADADNAGLWDDPMFSADVSRFIQSTAHPWKVMASVGFTLPISGRLDIEKKRAGAGHAADLARVYDAEWRTRIELRKAWAEWSAARERAEVTREFLGRLRALVEIVDRIGEAGEMPRLESRLFHLEQGMREVELSRDEASRTAAELAIKQLMGLAPATPLTLAASAARKERPDVNTTRDQVADTSTALAIARAEYEVSERSLQLEIRRQYPDLTVGPGYGREEGMDEALLGVSIPLPILNANRAAIARTRAEREVARAAFETQLERVHADLASAEVALAAASEQRRIVSERVAPLAEQQYADALRTAELGEVNTLLLLESLSRRQDARLRLIDATLEETNAALRIDALLGPSRPPATAPTPSGDHP